MKISRPFLIIATAAAVAGCKPDHEPPANPATNTAELSQTAAQDLNSAKDSAIETRDEFLAAMRKKMQILDARIKALADKSANYQDDAKARADQALADLRSQREVVRQKYDDLKQSGQDAWEKTKAAFNHAWGKLETTYDNVKTNFNQ